MECTPFHDQSPASRTRCGDFGSHQGVIRRHDSEKRPGPVRNHRDGADQKAQLFCLPPSDEAEQATRDRERRLHCEPTLIGRLPFGKQRLVVKSETSWLLGDIDVQCRSREERGDDQRKMTDNHISPFRAAPLSPHARLLPLRFGARTCGSAGSSCRTAGIPQASSYGIPRTWCGDNGAARKGETHGKVKITRPPRRHPVRLGPRGASQMAFIMCDDHNLSIEADGMDPTAAKRLMLGAETKPDPTPLEKQIIDFGMTHRDCNLRVLAD